MKYERLEPYAKSNWRIIQFLIKNESFEWLILAREWASILKLFAQITNLQFHFEIPNGEGAEGKDPSEYRIYFPQQTFGK